ncbi:MAG TPA: glycosyltransferase, partial [Candidatus Acidoferrum sp.]|nr:glycosyltransferase [Candidatus Acidoferrum sp.]
MIFVSVGSQAPFDRLIRAVDQWAKLRGRADVFAQIAKGGYHPTHMKFTDFVDPSEFKRLAQEAQFIVAHAGMGCIISALELGKPIVVMPRRGCFSETRNDHQVAAARHFGEQGRLIVALDEQEIPEKLDYALDVRESDRIDTKASPKLLATLRSFLEGDTGNTVRQSRPSELKKM